MATKWNLVGKVAACLQHRPDKKFTAREIAAWIFETYPDECQKKIDISKTINTVPALHQQLAAEMGRCRHSLLKQHPKIKTTEERPRKYYYTESSDSDEIANAEADTTTTSAEPKLKEHDLYPLLTEYLWSELEVYSKRIDEKRSANSRGAGGNKWLYPDIVGMEDLSSDWNREIKDCVQQYTDKKTKLWSFEVKILINRSNIREVFFQTVSNSSWANFSYLVAKEIVGADTLKELRILASLHGIGFIHLNIENPSESQIIIPAKERLGIDWNTANRLAKENKDFSNYIKLIRQFYQTGEVNVIDWDTQPLPED